MSQKKDNNLNLIIPSSSMGLRLDKYLGSIEGIQSRSRAIQLIQSDAVLINGKKTKGSYILKGGESLSVDVPEPTSIDLQPLELQLDILYEDEYLIVLNKPSGLVVHPAAGHEQDTLVNALLAHSRDYSMKFGEQRPGIVHRLDKDTSGIMVIAKTDFIHESLALQFKERSISRYYLALTAGVMHSKSGSLKSFLARHPKDRKRFSSVKDLSNRIIRDIDHNPGIGKWSHTDYQVLASCNAGISYVKLKLHTGRTHQIRVHMAEFGFPILGDPIYGNTKIQSKKVPRLALHASELGFIHPISRETLNFKQKWSNDFIEIIKSYFGEIKE